MSSQSPAKKAEAARFNNEQLYRRPIMPAGRFVGIVFASNEALVAGDDAGGWFLVIPEDLNGLPLTCAHAAVYTPSGAVTIQVRNVTQAADMLSTAITIDAAEHTSYTAATQPVIIGTPVATGNIVVVDVDAAGSAVGLDIILGFTPPLTLP